MTDNRWRKDLITRIKNQLTFLKDRTVQFPETFELLTGAKGNLFEFGGQDHDRGSAMIISSPSGKPSFSRILHRRWPNEIHAAVTIWPGCLVALGSHYMGKENLAIYVVSQIVPPKDTNKFGSAILKRVAFRTPISHSGTSPNFWYETEMEIPAADNLVSALREKLYTYNCTEPLYVEWFHSVKNNERAAMTDFLIEHIPSTDEYGIGDVSIKKDAICHTFEQFMESVRLTANDLNENYQKKFVWVQFGFFIKDEKLVCQARHLTNNKGALWPLNLHDTLFQVELEEDDQICEFMNRFNPSYYKVILGTESAQGLIWYLNNNKTTSTTLAKYAKCTAKPDELPQKKEPERVQVGEMSVTELFLNSAETKSDLEETVSEITPVLTEPVTEMEVSAE